MIKESNMAKDAKVSPPKGQQPKMPSNVVSLNDHKCRAEDCKKKPDRAGFCTEHYAWFKWGLITMEGYKARDFDKKFQGFLEAQKAA